MLARLLAALPSVRTARDLAVAEQKIAHLDHRDAELCRILEGERAERRDLQAKYDRLVEARLYRQGDIASPVLTQPKTPAPLATGPFGAFGRLVMGPNGTTYTEPVGDDDMG
jgi:hypothetical protein